MRRRYQAPLVTAAGIALIFGALFTLSPVVAFVALAGALLVVIGLFALEVSP